MDTLPLLGLVGAALGGALTGAAACYWPLSRVIVELRLRLERSEQVRNGAVERSAQARDQIAQLNRAITDLRRAHSARTTPSQQSLQASQRELLETTLDEGEEKTLVLPRRETVQAFADTQLLGNN